MILVYIDLGWVIKIDESLRAISPVNNNEKSFSFIFTDNTSIKLTGSNILKIIAAQKKAIQLFEVYIQATNDAENADFDEEEEPDEEENHAF